MAKWLTITPAQAWHQQNMRAKGHTQSAQLAACPLLTWP